MNELEAKISCIVVDDEPLQVELVRDYVGKVDKLELKGSFTSALESIRFVENNGVQLVFLDIQMPELTGVQVMEILKGKAKFILTTAYTDYALKSYEYDVIDYLVKPISFERFYLAVEKAKSFFPGSADYMARETEITNAGQFLFIKSGTRINRIDLNDILYIEGLKDYVQINTTSGNVLTLENMSAIETKLRQHNFIRIHKSYIIALSKISYIEKGYVVIANKSIPIGNTYREVFYKRIDNSRLGKNS